MSEYSETLTITTNNDAEYEIEVFFDYQPEEAEVRYYSDGSGYPGCPEQFYINAIEYRGKNVTKLNWDFDRIEEMLSEERNNY